MQTAPGFLLPGISAQNSAADNDPLVELPILSYEEELEGEQREAVIGFFQVALRRAQAAAGDVRIELSWVQFVHEDKGYQLDRHCDKKELAGTIAQSYTLRGDGGESIRFDDGTKGRIGTTTEYAKISAGSGYSFRPGKGGPFHGHDGLTAERTAIILRYHATPESILRYSRFSRYLHPPTVATVAPTVAPTVATFTPPEKLLADNDADDDERLRQHTGLSDSLVIGLKYDAEDNKVYAQIKTRGTGLCSADGLLGKVEENMLVSNEETREPFYRTHVEPMVASGAMDAFITSAVQEKTEAGQLILREMDRPLQQVLESCRRQYDHWASKDAKLVDGIGEALQKALKHYPFPPMFLASEYGKKAPVYTLNGPDGRRQFYVVGQNGPVARTMLGQMLPASMSEALKRPGACYNALRVLLVTDYRGCLPKDYQMPAGIQDALARLRYARIQKRLLRKLKAAILKITCCILASYSSDLASSVGVKQMANFLS